MGNFGALVLILIVCTLFIGSIESVYAAITTLSDQASCTALGGFWTTPPPTCTLSNSLTIASGDSLIINPGITLEFAAGNNLVNKGSITNNGIIILTGTATSYRGSIQNLDASTFTNSGTINLIGGAGNYAGSILNENTATFTNSGTINLTGAGGGHSGAIVNRDTTTFTNTGFIFIRTGSGLYSGLIVSKNATTFTNNGSISITSGGLFVTQTGFWANSSFLNTGTISLTHIFRNSATAVNSGTIIASYFSNVGGTITNTGSILVTNNFNNINGEVLNCGTITGNLLGNPIVFNCVTGSSSNSYQDPTIGKSRNGIQQVENGICIDIQCWTVTADYQQDFELVEMLSDSVHTISTTVFCQKGVTKCNYIAFGVSPYGTNINDSIWKIILQKDHLGKWTMTVIDPDGYLSDVTSTTQIVNDGKHLSVSVTALFMKPTPGMILNIEVRDSGGGYRDFKFNDGVAVIDKYAYPTIETSYDDPLEVNPLCINENANKRYTCAFDLVIAWTIKNAEKALDEIY